MKEYRLYLYREVNGKTKNDKRKRKKNCGEFAFTPCLIDKADEGHDSKNSHEDRHQPRMKLHECTHFQLELIPTNVHGNAMKMIIIFKLSKILQKRTSIM